MPATKPIILHPTDFSAGSQRAFAHALRVTLATRGKLVLLHVDPDPEAEPRWSDFPGVRSTLEQWGLLAKGSSRESLGRLGLRVEKVAARGMDPHEGIRNYLETNAVELIVLATHARRGLPRWLSRAVAEPVARRARVMTLFVSHAARGFVSPKDGSVALRRILVPVAHDPSPAAAVLAANGMAQILGEEKGRFALTYVGEAGDMPTPKLPDGTWSWEPIVRRGERIAGILEVATRLPADLVVMTTRGRKGWVDAVRGNTTERVLRRARCPVLAVPDDWPERSALFA